jgi:adenylate cyclase
MALAQSELRFWHGLQEDGMPAAKRALELDANQPEALCVMARYHQGEDRTEEANAQLAAALRLEPDSWEVNKEAAHLTFRQGRIEDAVPFFEKAMALVDTDYHDAHMLVCCYEALGDQTNLRRAAQITIARVEKEIAHDPTNGSAMAMGAGALCALGESERAREWVDRAMLMDPENISMRYNLACALAVHLHDYDAALDLLGAYFEQTSITQVRHADVDPDLNGLRSLPRYREMREGAEARLVGAGQTGQVPSHP